ncbi:hypothetical protein [Maribacter confluentis]|uniref:hypothetical protein n=1 Tax=Maribacter confluentis TaxID=1656093 RepID=UPI0036D2EE74
MEGQNGPNQIGPFNKTASLFGKSTGHVPGETGKNCKTFSVDQTDVGKSIILKFDGVYLESEGLTSGELNITCN